MAAMTAKPASLVVNERDIGAIHLIATLSAPSGNPSGSDEYLYHEFLNESKIKRSKFEQDAVWMDSIRDGHGYFSIDTSNTQPISGPSSSNIQALRIERNLTFVESLGSYFGIDDNPDTIGSSGPTASGSSGSSTGGSAGTASFPPGSSGPNSHLPAVGDGSMTGNFRMITTDAVKSDYQWKQTSFSRFANATFRHVQKDITKIGNQATHSENRGLEYVADFLENGRTSYHTETTKATASEWNNTTFGASISDYRLGGSTTSQVHSTFQGNHTRTTVNSESDTGESVHDNVGKTMTTATFAAASANGFASQTTTENYVVVPLLTMNSIIKKVTTETITESVTGTYLSEVNLLDISGYGSQYSGGIQLSRTTGMTSVSSFTMQPPVTQAAPANSETKHWGGSVQLSEIKTFAYGSMEDPDEYSAIVKTLSTRFWGTLKLAFGVAEVAVGTAAVYTGVGAPFGVIAIVHGLDTMYAGAAQVVSGTESDTLTKRLANSVFLASFKPANEQEKQQLEMFGEGIDSLVGIVGGLGGMGGAGALFKGAKQLKQGAGVAKAAGGIDDVGAAAGSVAKSSAGQNLRAAASTIDNANDLDDIANRLNSIGSELYGDERLAKLGAYLARRGVNLEVGSSRLLPGKAGSFIAHADGTATLLLKADPTKQLVWHELGHFLHWQKLGPKAYMELPRQFGNNVPEQFVFDLLERPSRWGRLSANYQDHAIDYITNVWGGVGR